MNSNILKNSDKNIGVVTGGMSHERDKSVLYGQQILKVLKELGANPQELHLHPNGSWTIDGKIENLEIAVKKVDIVWNCLVGVDGENANIENICEKCNTKVLGHGDFHTNLASNKKNLQNTLLQHKVKSPYGKTILRKDFNQEKIKEVFAMVGIPAIVKPLINSGAWGVNIINNFTEMENAVEYLLSEGQDVLVEKVVKGINVSCFVLEHNHIFHTHVKSDENINREDIFNVRNEALLIHNSLAFGHHVEYEFILSPKGLYFIEANTHPSLVHGYIKDIFKKGQVSLSDYVHSKI